MYKKRNTLKLQKNFFSVFMKLCNVSFLQIFSNLSYMLVLEFSLSVSLQTLVLGNSSYISVIPCVEFLIRPNSDVLTPPLNKRTNKVPLFSRHAIQTAMTVTIAQLRTVYIGRKPAPEGMADWRGLCDLRTPYRTIQRNVNHVKL